MDARTWITNSGFGGKGEAGLGCPTIRENGHDWYALYTRHQHEKKVANHLSFKGFETFLPLYQSVHRWRDRRKQLSLPLFPCYVFFRGDLERRLDILKTPGVHSLVCTGTDVAAISDAELEPIRRVMASRLPSEPFTSLHCGDRVRIITGPLTGIEGTLLRKKDKVSLILLVNLLRRGVSVEVGEASVELVTVSSKSATMASVKPAA